MVDIIVRRHSINIVVDIMCILTKLCEHFYVVLCIVSSYTTNISISIKLNYYV